MAEDYTTLPLVKESITGLTGTAARDAFLAEKITSASRSIDRHCGRRFWLDAAATARVINPRRKTVRDLEGERLLIADVGDPDTLVVEVGKDSTWTDITSQVEAEPTDAPNLGEPEPFTSLLWSGRWAAAGRVRITARWGWPAIPQAVREAALIQAIRLYKRKDSPEGVLGSSEWGTVRVSRLDPDVAKLVETYVLPGFA